MPQWLLLMASNRVGEKALESRKYRTTGGSSVLLTRRLSSTEGVRKNV
jgi:hypothetical protein